MTQYPYIYTRNIMYNFLNVNAKASLPMFLTNQNFQPWGCAFVPNSYATVITICLADLR